MDGGLDGGVDDAGLGDAGQVELPEPGGIGGALTTEPAAYGSMPFLTPASGLRIGSQPRFSIGRELFAGDWEPAPGTRVRLDGLGPLFNARSCVACHPGAGRAPSLVEGGEVQFGLLFRTSHQGGGHRAVGAQLQPFGIPGVAGEGSPSWRIDTAPDGFEAVSAVAPRPYFSLEPRPDLEVALGPRLSPQLVGVGLLDRVEETQILERADPEDQDGDGISGRASRPKGPEGGLGRFGWKAIHVSLVEQAAGAFVNDMGITSPLHPEVECTVVQEDCRNAVDGGSPEVASDGLEAVAVFLSHLAVPAARRNPEDVEIDEGARHFARAGCETCHRETLTTGADPAMPLLSNQVFHPYTDLLLHDMGPALADPAGEIDAGPREWRTPPLWGLGLVEGQPGSRFLHDGRAQTLEQAIRWHDGEAAKARDHYEALGSAERAALLRFLRSL